MEGERISSSIPFWSTRWLYVSFRVDLGRAGKRRVVDAKISWLLCLLGAVSSVDMVFYERNSVYLENYYMLHSWRADVEVR